MNKIVKLFFDFPVYIYKKRAVLMILLSIIILIVSVFMITNLKLETVNDVVLPDNDDYLITENKLKTLFLSADFIILSLEAAELYDLNVINAITGISITIKKIPGITQVMSLATLNEIYIDSQQLITRPLLDRSLDMTALKEKINADTIFRNFIFSDDERLHTIYIFKDEQADGNKLVAAILNELKSYKEYNPHLFGSSVVHYYMETSIIRDLIILGLAALIIIYILQVIYTRSLITGLILWLCSFFPAITVFIFFPMLGLNIERSTVLFPVIILALSTSYNIHFYRYFVYYDRDMIKAIIHSVPVILFAGGTTILGFLTLIFSPMIFIVKLSVILMAGIFIAMCTALFLLPALLSFLKIKHLFKPILYRISDKGFKAASILVVFLLIASAIAIPQISYDFRLDNLCKQGSPFAKNLDYFYDHFKGFNYLELVIDTKEEYGLVNEQLFKKIRIIASEIEKNPSVSHVISFTTFVDWIGQKMVSSSTNNPDLTSQNIGESLELIVSSETGLPVGSIIDINYSVTRLLIQFGVNNKVKQIQAVESYRNLVNTINRLCKENLDGISYTIMGQPVKTEKMIAYLWKSQLTSVFLFMVLLFIISLLAFKSFRLALLSLIPPSGGVLFFLGIMGWFNITVSVSSALSIAMILGVSVDNILYLLLLYQKKSREPGIKDPVGEAVKLCGTSIIQVTVLLIISVSVLFLSDYTLVNDAGLLVIAGLLVAAFIVLTIIPGLIRIFDKKEL